MVAMVTVVPMLGLKALPLTEREVGSGAVHPENRREWWWWFEDETAYTLAQDAVPYRHLSGSYEGPRVAENWG